MYDKFNIKRPLVFYSVSLAIGCISSIVFLDNILISAALAVSFFIILFLTLEIKFYIFNVLFFIFGVISFNIYFHVNIKQVAIVRVIEKKEYYFIGDFRGRKIILTGKTKELEEGQKIKAEGDFKRKAYVEKGIVGNYILHKYDVYSNDPIYNVYRFKKNIYKRFKKFIGENRAAMVMSLCYGETSYMNEEQMDEFQKLGIIHAVSVSGFHMAIIYKSLEIIFGLKMAVIISALYVIFTGMASATIRSFIMILIFKLSKTFFREYDSISSLSLSALILMSVKPYYIIDIGFGLSFLSTLGIILYNEVIHRKLVKIPDKIASNISLSLSSQIFSMPYIAFTLQKFSLGFLAGNMFLIPIFSIIVVLGNMALCLCFIEPIFKFICLIINFVFILEESINMVVLKFSPNIFYLKYIDGLIIGIIYLSLLMYKHKYAKFKHVPLIFVILVFFQSYSFFPTISFINNSNGQVVILKKGLSKILICNYDYINDRWVKDIKCSEEVEKVITNPEEGFMCNLSKNMYFKVECNVDNYMITKFYNRGKEFNFFISKSHKKYSLNGEKNIQYVIMLNKLIRIK